MLYTYVCVWNTAVLFNFYHFCIEPLELITLHNILDKSLFIELWAFTF